MEMGIWAFVGIIVLFVLFFVGCALAQSQAEAEIGNVTAAVRYRVIVRTHGYGDRKWHESTHYCASIGEGQEILNSYNWPSVMKAVCVDSVSNEKWVAANNGIFHRVRGVTIDV